MDCINCSHTTPLVMQQMAAQTRAGLLSLERKSMMPALVSKCNCKLSTRVPVQLQLGYTAPLGITVTKLKSIYIKDP